MLNVSQLSRTDILKAAADFSTGDREVSDIFPILLLLDMSQGPVLRRAISSTMNAKSIFDTCDRDHDGFVSLEELTAFIKTTEQVPSSAPLTPIIINNYERFDQNHDNRLDFEEFVEMITNDTFLKDFTNLGNRYVKFLVVPVCRTKRITKVQLQRMHTITGMYENEVKFKATDIGMIMLSLIQIILFYTSFKDQLVFKHDKRQQVWRYVTYMFTHNSQFHLFENVAIQLLVGLPLEMVHSWRVLIIYSAGILGGALFQSVIYPYEDLAGGSPGVYSILTAHIATVIMNWREMSQPVVQLIIFGTFSVFDTIYNYITIRNSDEISYISHLGGAVCGLLVGVNILRNLRETSAEKIIWWICIVLYFGIMGTFIGLELRLNLFKGAQPTR
ncbi:rhomboid-related protein 1-like [Dendroctonus ponderosae]|nr:rhomboid-related protein 1-like [Dendroctonus ponderosae]